MIFKANDRFVTTASENTFAHKDIITTAVISAMLSKNLKNRAPLRNSANSEKKNPSFNPSLISVH